MAQWLHRVIVAVWVYDKAPVDRKRALIVPLVKGKGSARDATNRRPNRSFSNSTSLARCFQ
jgi:hypothetical protein